MIKQLQDCTRLHNGVAMPWFGLGVFKIREGEAIEQAVGGALEAGYRSIDTAAMYKNEAGVGRAVNQSNIPRSEIFITTKVWNSDQGYDKTLAAFDTSLNKLALDYVDLYLVHWPVAGKYTETWRALETIYQEGRAKAIGVSNFLGHHLEDLLQSATVKPMVNQVEYHPYLQQPALYDYCREQQIQLEAWSPLMRGQVMEIPALVELGQKYGKNAVQITLRWLLQREIVVIPKSGNRERIQANADIFDFELQPDDMELINRLDRHHRTGPDPDNFDF